MKYDPHKHHRPFGYAQHRRSIRLKGYDYSQPGWYFITLCTNNREKLLGEVIDGNIKLNELGKIAEDEWLKTAEIRKNIIIDQYIIMPNHLHGIIGIVEVESRSVRANSYSPQLVPQSTKPKRESQPSGFQSPSKTIGAIIRGYKGAVTKKINILLDTPGASVWQRNYFERVIRNEPELNRIRKYIIENPAKWQNDKYY
jgi:putative transposase